MNSPIHRVNYATPWLKLPLPGRHQKQNATLALAVVTALRKHFGKCRVFEKAFANVQWPGRFDIQGRYILDGAHNPDGARTLRLTLKELYPGLKPAFIVGILADKDITEMVRQFAKVASRVYTVPIHSSRAADPETIADAFRAIAPKLPVESCPNLKTALQKTETEDRVVITGSLHFIGEAMEHLGLHAGRPNERSLNEWTGKGP